MVRACQSRSWQTTIYILPEALCTLHIHQGSATSQVRFPPRSCAAVIESRRGILARCQRYLAATHGVLCYFPEKQRLSRDHGCQ
jgi:hypothetical protein